MKKKPHTKIKNNIDVSNRPHRHLLAHAQSLHHLCGAYQFALLGLQCQNKIRVSDDSLACLEFRYYHR